MKNVSLMLISLFTMCSYGQRINEYEFAVVSTKFQFQRTEHEYRLNALLKDRLQDFGFQTFYKSDAAIRMVDPCLYLNAEVVNVSNIFLTKLQVVFKDCLNGIVFQSEIGTSESKDRYESFNEALFNALKSVRNINYKFTGKRANIAGLNESAMPLHSNQAPVDQMKPEDYLMLQTKVEDAKVEYAMLQAKLEQAKRELAKVVEAKNDQSKVQQLAMNNNNVDLQKAESIKVAQVPVNLPNTQAKSTSINAKEPTEKPNIAPEISQSTTSATTVVEADKSRQVSRESNNTKSMFVEKTDGLSKEILFASPIENGYQLMDNMSQIVLILEKTLQPEYYNANIDKKFGVVYRKVDQWVFEYYQEGILVVEPLKIRF